MVRIVGNVKFTGELQSVALILLLQHQTPLSIPFKIHSLAVAG
jgi:hypothetical protein